MSGTAATTIAGSRRGLLVGMWSAWLFFDLSVAYAATVAAGGRVPKDPYWAIAEISTIVGAVILVILMAVIQIALHLAAIS